MLRWSGDAWQEQHNPVDIALKYRQRVAAWHPLPTVLERWEHPAPCRGILCVVSLVGDHDDDHGYALAWSDGDNGFQFDTGYENWGECYDDWQIVGFGVIPESAHTSAMTTTIAVSNT
jgi:hypothetical protein